MKVIDYNSGWIDESIILLLGYFDGMHIGHQKLLQSARAVAKEKGYKIAIMTFLGNKEKEVIYTYKERLYTFETLKIDYCIAAEFDLSFREQSGLAFIKHLTKICNLKGVACGKDFTFGYGATEGVQTLKEICTEQNIITIIEEVCSDVQDKARDSQEKNATENTDNDKSKECREFSKESNGNTLCNHHISIKNDKQKISTSTIKQKIKEGALADVERLLGGKYLIMGQVVEGNKLGRTINFPTANINLAPEKVVLKNGVYAVHVLYEGKSYKGIASLGNKPTVDTSNAKLLEVHIFDFQKDIYQEEIIVYFDKFIREIQKFENLEQLKNQIKNDIESI